MAILLSGHRFLQRTTLIGSPEVCCFLKWNSLTDETLEVQKMKETKTALKKKKKKLPGDSEMSSPSTEYAVNYLLFLL